MKHYVFSRLLQLIPILFVITFLSFAMMRLAGSDVVLQSMERTGMAASDAVVAAARAELGLDKPFLTQYFTWLGKLLQGDMGRSYVSGRPVFETFIAKLPATLLLTGVSVGLTLLVSLPLGVFSAVNQNRWGDWVIRSLSFVGNSIPNFFAALLLLYIFAIQLQWLPVISRTHNADRSNKSYRKTNEHRRETTKNRLFGDDHHDEPQTQQSPSDAAPIGMPCSRSRRRLLGRRQGKAGQDGSCSHDFCFWRHYLQSRKRRA